MTASKAERAKLAAETFRQIKERYEMLRAGQAIYVAHPKSASDRVSRVGRTYIHTISGAKLTGRDVAHWWYG